MKSMKGLLVNLGFSASLLAGTQMAQAQTAVLQPGPGAGKDIWTTSVYSYVPPGGGPGGGLNNEYLRVGGWADQYYSLIEFDLTGMAQVATSARLELFSVPEVHGYGATGLYLDRITEFWDWRIQGTGADMERLWWADRPAAVQWGGPLVAANGRPVVQHRHHRSVQRMAKWRICELRCATSTDAKLEYVERFL